MIWVAQQRKVIYYKNTLFYVIIKNKWLSNITAKPNDSVKHWILSYPDIIDYTDVNDDNQNIKEDIQKGFC